ncbi:hypothetical protein LHYA1_G007029 [Lachnellula hyalina]|uniref:Riboflavin kinase n=1 Tax=Lachnellula hyalina TaxID=1316788 RepID=A0A8H8TXU4_9HELO|nr:uncharacterized protein LHYA1_G007029 [Lachnellula hyalina]TVY24247.1 hypothetical protein LHYA1_G007029 [Lachnellula hyalina]
MPPRFTEPQMYASPQSSGNVTPQSLGPSSSTNSLPSSAASSPYSEAAPSLASASTSTVAKSNAVQNAFREVRHFAGGLISHPYETTKHFTLLRHSHGLVFFQGPTTSLAISIFSDGPLPPDRTIWLQNKGFSGKTGMRLKALMGANGSWLNVTPTMAIESEQLNPSDERAWQRDITQFRKKAKPTKIREKHKLRETVVLRIPAEAGDGYFSVVLCTGDKKKNLCTSPTFRLLSTSTSMHSIKGASLSTLPLELGAMAVNVYATSKIAAVAGPVASVVQNRVQKYMPSTITTAVVKGAGTKAYDMAGSHEKLQKYMPSEATRENVKKASTKAYDMAGGKEKVHAQVHEKFRTVVSDGNTLYEQQLEHSNMSSNTDIALDAGPQPPYPIRFTCTSEPLIDAETSLPTTNLAGVPDHVTNQLYGHYFAWVRPQPKGEDWQPSLISALPPDPSQLSRANFALANKRLLTLRLIDGYAEPLPPSAKLTILVLGFLRPDEPLQRANLKRGIEAGDEAAEEAAMFAEMNDVAIAQGVLDHPAWDAEVVMEGQKGGLKKGYADVRMGVQRGVDKVPLYKLGVRMEGDKTREKGLTVGGFYVLR